MKAPEDDVSDSHSDSHYELDLEKHAPADIDEAFKDAVAAVDRSQEVEPTVAEASAGEPSVTGSSKDDDKNRSQLESETTSLRERLMRTLADFDNYRKRTEREKQSLRRFANFDVFKDFIGVLDNFERAMEASGSADDLKQGLKMVARQQEEILQRHGVTSVDSVGKPFDPKVHEAVAREESVEVREPTVTKELQRGYLLHDRLLRPAMVYVAMPSNPQVASSDEAVGEEAGEASD